MPRKPSIVFPDDLQDDWVEQIMDMFAQGLSQAEVAARFPVKPGKKITWKIYEHWLDKPDFREIIEDGLFLSLAWWEREGRTNIGNRQFNAVLWYMQMKNRYGYRDRIEQTNIQREEKPKLNRKPQDPEQWSQQYKHLQEQSSPEMGQLLSAAKRTNRRKARKPH